ncbi:NACHT, LRR and PYD domains-containing protein 12-like isoform X1 [Triplophysa rosa]|uniref:NACHT, LRR and PYD domains-containing protein 12-like isoform X1 n=1 Tax=Triplophysa rosa TaxID=992332 RepID=UPI002545F2D0|nr:NACHT, LRR and PYD domains-containing protein 12-like isoform X1 [Triplophysa rosa]
MEETKTYDFSPGCSSVKRKTPDSECSRVSMKSNQSMGLPTTFKSEDTQPDLSLVDQRRSDPESSCLSMKRDQSMGLPTTFKSEDTWQALLRSDVSPRRDIKEPVCKRLMQSMNQDFNEDTDSAISYTVINAFRSNLQMKCQCLYERVSRQENPILLNEIYTELYITESESGEISNEHEVRQIETQSRRTKTRDTPIKCSDIFKPLPAQDKPIRCVLTKGVAGIGKTVSVQKFILDWAEGKANQDVHLIFPLPFRELNLMKDNILSLSDLLHVFFSETKEIEIFSDEYKVLFIFDGLDECQLHLNFHNNQILSDVNESASVDVMLTNLMAGNLLPSALIWITSRPAAADLIPSECVDRVTEVRGFTDKQKEEYFSKRISDESLANRIISHLKSSRSLYIMCHIPVFCWISATVLERMSSEPESEKIPETLTEMYTHFLIIQTNIKHQKDYEKNDEDMIFKLGKLAFEQLVKGNVIFYDEDLRECGIDVAEASVYSGLCTQIFREEFGLYQGKVYSFVHLSIQEHLAALYAHMSFTNNNTNVFDPTTLRNEGELSNSGLYQSIGDTFSISDLHQRAVNKTLQSKNGRFDLFLCFLLGLSLESNQKLLQGLMTRGARIYKSNEKTVGYIKQKISENPSPEKFINLFHCLNELDDHSLVEEIQHDLRSRKLNEVKLSSSQWSAVLFVLLTSEQTLNEFYLNEFVSGENVAETLFVLQKLLPVICESTSVQLCSCNITDEGCAALTSALRSNPSHLRELNLSKNNVGDSGVKLISTVLANPHCKLEKLMIRKCNITDKGCADLTSSLRLNPSHLTQLSLSNNNVGDSGLKLISGVLENPHCKLEKLWLYDCDITAEGCVALTSALRSNPLNLKELYLSWNNLGDSGVKLISAELENPHCKIEILRLSYCHITAVGCADLTSALRLNPSHLREMNLTGNTVGDSGVKLISTLLANPHCKLEMLWLSYCNITDEGCADLTSALRLNSSHLREMNLTGNNVGDSGVKLISVVLENPHCKLKILKLAHCNITDEGCVALTSALRSNPSHLEEIDLSGNKIGGSGVKLLSNLKDDPHFKLKTLQYAIIRK